jgi:threonine/homoserine/homoserine lactone efflux protein
MTPPYGLPSLTALPEAPAGAVGTLTFAALAIMGSPGPSTISLVGASVAYGVRRSTAYCLGLIAGTIVVLLAAATGVTVVLFAVPALRWALIVAATAYILWLAYHLATAPPLTEQTRAERHPRLIDGLVLGVINPKAWIAITAVFASARLADTALVDAALKIPLLAAVVVGIHAVWLFAGRLMVPVMRRPRLSRAVNVALAVLLVVASLLALLPSQ